eukprot:6154251-Pyramimonas_sp.AAC.1
MRSTAVDSSATHSFTKRWGVTATWPRTAPRRHCPRYPRAPTHVGHRGIKKLTSARHSIAY